MDLTRIDFRPIIEKAKTSEDGLADLLRIIQPYVLNKARYYLSDDHEAQDIYQIISLRLYNNLNNINPDTFVSYLKTAVTNACNDVFRKRHKSTEEDEYITTVSIDAYEDWDIADTNASQIDLTDEYRNAIVKEVIDSLPDTQRQVIILRYMDDMKIKDIAEKLDINENTVKTRLNLAYKKIENEILTIQKRDDIKLYSYSPVLFFLLLLRRDVEYLGTANELLIKDTVDGVSKGTINETASEQLVRNISQDQTVNKNIVNETIKTGTKAAAVATKKAGISTAIKVVIGLLTAALIGGGYLVYDHMHSAKMNELYQNDEVEIVVSLDDDSEMYIGDTRKIDISYTSKNDLKYDLVVTNNSEDIISIDDDTITASKAGDAKVIIAVKRNDQTIKRTTYELKILDETINGNRTARLMKQEGYQFRCVYNPAFSSELMMPYSQFDWSKADISFEEFMNSDVRNMDKDGLLLWASTGNYTSNLMKDYYATWANADGITVDEFLSKYGLFPYPENVGIVKQDGIRSINLLLNGNVRASLTLTYEPEYDKYSYESKVTGRKEYVDFTSVFFTPVISENTYYNSVDIEYDDQYNVTKVSARDPWSSFSYEFKYEDGKVVQVYEDRDYSDTMFDIFYDDLGLMQYMIQYEAIGSQRVLGIHKYYYSTGEEIARWFQR